MLIILNACSFLDMFDQVNNTEMPRQTDVMTPVFNDTVTSNTDDNHINSTYFSPYPIATPTINHEVTPYFYSSTEIISSTQSPVFSTPITTETDISPEIVISTDNPSETGMIFAPASSSSLKKSNYNDVVLLFFNCGFENIKVVGEGDMFLGLIYTEGDVDYISIGEQSSFSGNDAFPKDDQITIFYHSFSKKEEDKVINGTKIDIQDTQIKERIIETNGLVFTIKGSTCSVKVGNDKSQENIIIPETIDGVNVTEIEKDAFKNCLNIRKLSIPKYIDSIYSMPSNFIEDGELYYDAENLSTIGNELFKRYSTTKLNPVHVVIGNNVKVIPGSFLNKYYITQLLFEDDSSCVEIKENAFNGCSYLLELSLPSSISKIGDSAFSGCKNLKQVIIPNKCETIGQSAFSDCDKIQSVTLSASLKTISSKCFQNCKQLTSITIPDGVLSIGGWAFKNCSYLVEVTIPSSVETIGYQAFCDCRINKLVLPNGVKKIETSAFSGCFQLKEVFLPDSIEKLGDYCFAGCNQLAKANIPSNITEIGEGVFNNSIITELTIPASVKVLKKSALGLNNLRRVVFEDVDNWFAGSLYIEPELLSDPETAASTYKKNNGTEWKKMK